MSWVSAKEGLPEESGEYQVTLKHLDGDYKVEQMRYINDKWQGIEEHPSWQVVAWQSLPEPYNGLDWKKAEEHLLFIQREYVAIGPVGYFGLTFGIMPLLNRFNNGERTQELYDEIMATKD